MTGIVDCHVHVWRRRDLPWLDGPMRPRIFGPYEPLRRDYPIEEYLEDVAGSGVAAAVYVQANWAPERFEEEVARISAEAERTGWPQAIVGFADFTTGDVRRQLDRLRRYPLLRGLRQQFHWHENPRYRFAAAPDMPRHPTVVANIRRLAEYGLRFELQIFAHQAEAACELLSACPGVTFVLQHAGMPEDLSARGTARWRQAMGRLAAHRNLVVKLSGLGTFLRRNDPDHVVRVVAETVALFGADRCLFGSNFPIEKLWTGYPALIAAYRRALESLGVEARRAIWRDTAIRVYRLASDLPDPI